MNREDCNCDKYYNAIHYGITADAEDNSEKLLKLMNLVSDNGGGIVYFPVGIYQFYSPIWAKSYVSIEGENKEQVVLKMMGEVSESTGPFALFYHHYPDNRNAILSDPVIGCTYSNFTVDATEVSCDRYRTGNKAFYYQNCIGCTWRDLNLIGTPATALGVDCLVNCFITRIYCKDCGRVWDKDVRYGGAAIGIGAGLYDEENVIVSECIVEGAGHFGIFFEHQALFNKEVYAAMPRGVIISNCIVRNGRNHGIGARGMTNMRISSNLIYGNQSCGIYIDNQAMNVDVSDNIILDNWGAGIKLSATIHDNYSGTTGNMDSVTLRNNHLKGNQNGIELTGQEERGISNLLICGNTICQNEGQGIDSSDCQARIVDMHAENNVILHTS